MSILWSAERVYVRGRFEKDWGIMVDDDGIIQSVGPRQQLVATARAVYHYPNRILLPAFINPHHHGFHRIYRGITNFNTSFQVLLDKLVWPLSHAIDNDLFDAVCRIALAEQALSGVATVGEFHYLHNGHFKNQGEARFGERLIRIATEMGMRLTLVYSFFDQGSDNASAFVQSLDVSQREFEALQEKYKDNPLINIIPGVHGLQHTSPEAIIAAAELAKKYDTRWHIQLAEREGELETSQLHYGTTPLRALDKMGVLDSRMVVINGTLLDEEELVLMREHDISIILCPSSSLSIGDDFPNTWSVLQEEIPFAVASDILGMNNNYSVADEIRWLEFSQRSLQKNMNILCSQAEIESLLELGTWLPAQMLGVNSAQLMPGSHADFMLISVSHPCARPPFNYNKHFMNQLIFGWGSQVSVTHLMVQGKLVVRNGFLKHDLSASYRRLEQWSEAFLRTMEKSAKSAPTNEVETESTQP